MKWSRNLKVEAELYNRLHDKYVSDRRDGIHLSSLIGCLTRSWYEANDPIRTTNKELGYFSIGFALEEVLLRDDNNYNAPPVQEFMGVLLSKDYITDASGNPLDLKSTRMYPGDDGSPKATKAMLAEGNKDAWPSHWLKQFKYYTLAHNRGIIKPTYDFDVAIMYLGVPELVCGTITFTYDELIENLEYIQKRKDEYSKFLFKSIEDSHKEVNYINADSFGGMIPLPFTYNEKWECTNCRYLTRCQLRASTLNIKQG